MPLLFIRILMLASDATDVQIAAPWLETYDTVILRSLPPTPVPVPSRSTSPVTLPPDLQSILDSFANAFANPDEPVTGATQLSPLAVPTAAVTPPASPLPAAAAATATATPPAGIQIPTPITSFTSPQVFRNRPDNPLFAISDYFASTMNHTKIKDYGYRISHFRSLIVSIIEDSQAVLLDDTTLQRFKGVAFTHRYYQLVILLRNFLPTDFMCYKNALGIQEGQSPPLGHELMIKIIRLGIRACDEVVVQTFLQKVFPPP